MRNDTGPGRIDTVWVFGDQLDPDRGPLVDHAPGTCRVLIVESEAKIAGRSWHRQRLHLVLSGLAHLADELRRRGHVVDHRRATTLSQGWRDHVAEFAPRRGVAMAPASWEGRRMLERLGVELVPNEQFSCHEDVFAEWIGRAGAGGRRVRQEDFYRFQRRRLGLLMDGDEPVGGRWNFDHDNREPPPTDGRTWPEPSRFELDAIDLEVIERLSDTCWGAPPAGLWPVTRAQALVRLDEFVRDVLPLFGPHEDAMLGAEWKLAHSTLASSLNLGLLHPIEVVERAEAAYHEGQVDLASAEGFIRQVVGWREYVWGLYWAWMPEYAHRNDLGADRPVPPVFRGEAPTEMTCVSDVMRHVHDHGYAHHIERLMVLGNLALTHGVSPRAMTEWMWASFVDGAEWVMVPNVVGMALHADGGQMATKPYASGGAYLKRMGDSCRRCRFDPTRRTGDRACPFTVLYWDFLARNAGSFAGNHRMSRPLAGMRRLSDLDAVRSQAVSIRARLDAGTL